jgi:hypothetical protein
MTGGSPTLPDDERIIRAAAQLDIEMLGEVLGWAASLQRTAEVPQQRRPDRGPPRLPVCAARSPSSP